MPKTSKKIMTYETLEEYNTKWHERLTNMVIQQSQIKEICEDILDLPESVDGPSLVCRPKASKPYNNQYYNIDDQFDLTLKFINNGNTSVALVEFAILYFITDSNPWTEYGEPRIAVIAPGESYSFVVPSLNVSEYDVDDGKLKIEIPYSYSTNLETDSYSYYDKINSREYYTLKPISSYFEDPEDQETSGIATWSELPIQNSVIETRETIYLVFGNNFKYEPSGGGTKHISIVNSRGAVNSTKFRLQIVNGGDFPIEWAENISWKYGEPTLLSYHTDTFLFETLDEGKTWIGEVTQTSVVTPYWKVVVSIMFHENTQWVDNESINCDQYIVLPISKDAIEYVDWDDGNISYAPFNSDEIYTRKHWDDEYYDEESEENFEMYDNLFLMHKYENADIYNIEIRSSKFNTGYILAGNAFSYGDELLSNFRNNLIEIVNPLPVLKGSYQYDVSGLIETDNSFESLLYNYYELTEIPDEFFKYNSTYPVGKDCFKGTQGISSIPLHTFANDQIDSFKDAFKTFYNLKTLPADLFANQATAIDFQNCFYGCRSLQSIPEGLFNDCISATNFNGCFDNCTSLASIPEGLFDNCISMTDCSICFYNCTSLQSIPEGLFKNCVNAINFIRTFYGCTSITSIPLDLFENCIKSTTFTGCFNGCTSITSIPSGLFDKNTAVTTFSECFYNCSSLASIPSGLFDKNTVVTSFYECFSGCTSLASIPSGLFDSNTAVTSFYSCFNKCNSLTTIPSNLFANNTAVTTFTDCFSGCTSLASIPSGLFDSNTAVTSFYNCFGSCSSLTTIPSNLFSSNTAVTTFQYCFDNCTSLAPIPSNLFNNNTIVKNFDRCFGRCSSLTTIPSNLFSSNTATTSFSGCFYKCTSLASIPAGLFDTNTATTNFSACFYGCTSLTSIPTGLFNSNTAVTSFYNCFYGCTSLASIPADLFNNNTEVTDFKYCFQNCSSIQSIPSNLFAGNIKATNFDYCFYGCSSLATIPTGLFDTNTAATNFSNCFAYCTALASIPENLFVNNKSVSYFQYCFYECDSLNDFAIRIGASYVSKCNDFVTYKAGTTRTVYVKSGTNTRARFYNVASTLGLTVVAE